MDGVYLLALTTLVLLAVGLVWACDSGSRRKDAS